MKKFAFLFIVLAALGGTGFYFGWVQIAIPPESRGVIFTKTRGWDDTAVLPGVFTWRWEKLIPNNFTLYLYPARSRSSVIEAVGSLPSSEVYGLFLDGKPEFRYTCRFILSYRVRDDAFARIAREKGVLPDMLDDWLSSVEKEITGTCAAAVLSGFEGGLADRRKEGIFAHLYENIRGIIDRDYPFLEVTDFSPQVLELPDMALYEKAREMYLLRAESRKETLAQNAREAMGEHIREDERMRLLRKYGELLTEYPVLLEYLKIEAPLEAARRGR
ncbi:MAG: hypothetical protein LBC67_07845 [Spirochaetales bacterium]|jgi:hypothetical protein|nr:hypothetical protein [Spirochaetales bacterium]